MRPASPFRTQVVAGPRSGVVAGCFQAAFGPAIVQLSKPGFVHWLGQLARTIAPSVLEFVASALVPVAALPPRNEFPPQVARPRLSLGTTDLGLG